MTEVVYAASDEQRDVHHYFYDLLGRLTDEVFDHWDNSLDYRDRFAYDPAGNRVEKSRDAGRDGSVDARTAYRFDVNDRLIDELAYGRSSDPESRTTYTYDHTQNTGYRSERFVSGSQTRTTLTHVYTYDLQGRLFIATVTNYNDAGTASSITRSTYDYGHTGIRVSAVNEIDSTADGTFETRTKIEYLVDHHNHTGYQQVIRESHYDVASGKLVKTVDYTFGHDEISQTVVTYNSAGTEVSRDKQWFLHDGKANVRGLLDAASAILTIAGIEQIYFYDAYGSLLNLQASQAATTLLYNGEMFDALTGNQYLRARYYNPLNAQFNRLDPFFGNHQDPQSFNRYAYAHGDAIGGTDPSGTMTLGSMMSSIGARLSMVGQRVATAMPTLIHVAQISGRYIAQNFFKWIAQAIFPTGIGSVLTANSSLLAWFGATVQTYILRMAFTSGINYLIRDAIEDNVFPAITEIRRLAAVASQALAGVDFALTPWDVVKPGAFSKQLLLDFADKVESSVGAYADRSIRVAPFIWVDREGPGGQFGLIGTLGQTIEGIKAYYGAIASINIVLNQTIFSVFSKLPEPVQNRLQREIGSIDLNSASFSPDMQNIIWGGITRTLQPEREIRLVRLAMQSVLSGNFEGAANDLISAVRGLGKYGTFHFNNA